jgi:hypothetical protein
MNAIIERPVASPSAGDPLAELVSACASLEGDQHAPPLGRALVSYWSVLGSSAATTRLRFLHGIRESVRQGRWPARVFAVAALGDADGEIVFSATLDYVALGPVPLERRDAAVLDVLEWIRRRLPLNVPARNSDASLRSSRFGASATRRDSWMTGNSCSGDPGG